MTVREIITVARLYAVAPVAYPAYPDTDLSARTKEAFAEYRALQDAGGSAGPDGAEKAKREAEVAKRERELRLKELELGG